MSEREKFWSDDFDLDLLKIFPELENQLNGMAGTKLWTVGHETYGRLNHPNIWNSHGAYVWSERPLLPRDEKGWFKIGACVGNEPVIECTWLEILRDSWVHGYGFILLPSGVYFPAADRNLFDQIMYHHRGWAQNAFHEANLHVAADWMFYLNRTLKNVLWGKATKSAVAE
jgi:hypothetical protein